MVGSSLIVHPFYVGAHFFGFAAGIAQAVHGSAQFRLGLGDVIGQFGLTLFILIPTLQMIGMKN